MSILPTSDQLKYGAGIGIQGLGALTPLLTGAAAGYMSGGAAAAPGFAAGSQLGNILSGFGSRLAGGNQQPQQQMQPMGAQQQSPSRQAQQQLLQGLSNFNPQAYIQEATGRYQQDIANPMMQRFASGGGLRSSAFRNAMQQGGEQFQRGLSSDIWQQQAQQRNMLSNYLTGQQQLRNQQLGLGMQGAGLGLQAGQLGLARAGAPLQALLQGSNVASTGIAQPYYQQGNAGLAGPMLDAAGRVLGGFAGR